MDSLNFSDFLSPIQLKWIQTGVVILTALILSQASKIWANRALAEFDMDLQRRRLAVKTLALIILLISIILITAIWGLKHDYFLLFISSALTILGVGFFAQWSLLSNITSGLILYFHHPLKLGDTVEIVDKDAPMKGTIYDITYFFIHIKNEKGEIFTVPNTEILNKTIHINPKQTKAPEN
ncbi:MAG: mechanosensitive ion channel domain-containing protein [Bacteroidota bacterium]